MDISWVDPALVGLGLAINFIRDAGKRGAKDQQLVSNTARLKVQDRRLDDVEDELKEHGERLARVEVRAGIQHGGD